MTHTDFEQVLSRLEKLSPEQVHQLRQQLDRQVAQPKKSTTTPPGKPPKRAKPVKRLKKPLSIDEIHQQMMARGLITRLPDAALDIDDDDPNDQPVPIKGEPLSETIIRERR
jgi:hypothetical protein